MADRKRCTKRGSGGGHAAAHGPTQRDQVLLHDGGSQPWESPEAAPSPGLPRARARTQCCAVNGMCPHPSTLHEEGNFFRPFLQPTIIQIPRSIDTPRVFSFSSCIALLTSQVSPAPHPERAINPPPPPGGGGISKTVAKAAKGALPPSQRWGGTKHTFMRCFKQVRPGNAYTRVSVKKLIVDDTSSLLPSPPPSAQSLPVPNLIPRPCATPPPVAH